MVDTCRVCLCSDRRMHSISNTVFVEVWEKLTNAKFDTNDGKPLLVCYICSAQLRKAHQLMKKALKAEELLTTVINIGSKQSQKEILLVASQTHDFHYKYAIGEVCQVECKQFESNTVGELKKENECRHEEYNKEEIDINMNEEERGNAEEEIDKENVGEGEKSSVEDIDTNEEERSNAEEEIDKENVGESEEGSEEENDINIKEEGDSNQEESAHISNGSGLLLSGDMLLKDILEREVRIILEKIDIGASASKRKSNGVPQNAKRINIEEINESVKCSTNTAVENLPNNNGKASDAVAASTSFAGSDGGKISSICNLRKKSKGRFSCHMCQYKCFQMAMLNRHLRKHTGEKPYMCDFCDFRVARKDYLGDHIKYKHTKEKNFSCHICQYKYVTKYKLTLHLRTHTGEKPYECEFCDYRSARKNDLENHIKYKHTKEKNYSCNLCQYKCVKKSELTVHLRTHTGEKLYECEFCDYRSARKNHLGDHIKYKHTKEKNFSCHICQYKCVTKYELTLHLRTHTGEKPYKCDFCDYKCTVSTSLRIHIRRRHAK